MKVDACERCGESGSLHEKWVLNKVGKRYYYGYVAHYVAKTKRLRWCYVGKLLGKDNDEETLPNTNNESAEGEATFVAPHVLGSSPQRTPKQKLTPLEALRRGEAGE